MRVATVCVCVRCEEKRGVKGAENIKIGHKNNRHNATYNFCKNTIVVNSTVYIRKKIYFGAENCM